VSLTMGLTRCYKTEGFLHMLTIIVIVISPLTRIAVCGWQAIYLELVRKV